MKLKPCIVALLISAAPFASHSNDNLSIAELEALFQSMSLSDHEMAESVGTAMPFTPDQIRAMRRHVDNIRQATSEPARPRGVPVVSSRAFSLEPGFFPETLRLEDGTVTSVVFQDSTGAPWPILSVITGTSAWTTTHQPGSNILQISPNSEYARSNMSIQLEGAPAPIMMILEAGSHKEVDYRLDAVVDGRGPNAKSISLDIGRSAAIAPHIIAIQDGVPPPEAQPLSVSGADGVRAWRLGERIVIRTRMTLSFPEAIRAASSADGLKTYEIEETPVVSLLDGGREFLVRIDI